MQQGFKASWRKASSARKSHQILGESCSTVLEGRKEAASKPGKGKDCDGRHPESEFQCLSLHLGHRPTAGCTKGLCFFSRDLIIGNGTTYEEYFHLADAGDTLQAYAERSVLDDPVLPPPGGLSPSHK